MRKIFVADFETRAGKQAEKENETWVWAWACCHVDNIDMVEVGTDIASFMSYCSSLGNSTIFFHNLKFDGTFIIHYLLKNGWIYVDTEKDVKKSSIKTFTCLIDGNGKFYSICFGHPYCRKYTRIYDSSKKIAGTVKSIGEDYKTKYQKTDIDLLVERNPGEELKEDEKEYVSNDVRVIGEVIAGLYDKGHKAMTVGSDCLHEYKRIIGGNSKFRSYFPVLEPQEDQFARKAYKGGWCYVNPKYQGYTLHCPNGRVFDVNSLYPSMMHSNEYTLADGTKCQNLYPYGKGKYFKGKPVKSSLYPLYIIHLKCEFVIKKDHLPTIQIKNSIYAENEYLSMSDGPTELWLTNVDYELFRKHYHIINETEDMFIDGYYYAGHVGFFDEYIDIYMNIKINSDGAEKETAKNFLNNLYGKFCQRVAVQSKIPHYNEEKDIVYYTKTEIEIRDPVYTPVGAFCTSYARRFTITAAQVNIDVFAYSDTDSIHTTDDVVGIIEHKTSLCCWKREAEWNYARYIRQKTYLEHNIMNGKDELILKCAGMNDKTKDYFREMLEKGKYTIENFDIGLEIKGLKLMPKIVKGGVILFPADFSINA